jgi:hypothetical protein
MNRNINVDLKYKLKLKINKLYIHKLEKILFFCDKYMKVNKKINIYLIRIINEYIEMSYEKIFEKLNNSTILITNGRLLSFATQWKTIARNL